MSEPVEEIPTEIQDELPESTMTLEDALAELKKVRSEAAQRRIKNRDLEEKAEKWKQYEDSQKTELQRLQDSLAEKDNKLAAYQLSELRNSVVKEFGLELDDAELLTGTDEASIRRMAEKLKARLGAVKPVAESRPVDLLAGNRGAPIGANSEKDLDTILRQMVKRR